MKSISKREMKMKKIILFLCCCFVAITVRAKSDAVYVISDIYAYNEKCPKDSPFEITTWGRRIGEDGLLIPNCSKGCEAKEALYIEKDHEKDFDICPNRETIDGYSILKQCPKEYPLRDYNGSCLPCLDGENFSAIGVRKPEDCEVCPNREYNDKLKYRERCQIKECPKDRPLRDDLGNCVSCEGENTRDSIFVNEKEENCGGCPNREFKKSKNRHYDRSDFCQIKECPEEFPLRGVSGKCVSCDEEYWTEDEQEDCEKCPNRIYVGKDQIVSASIDNKGILRFLKTTEARCYFKGKEPKPLFTLEKVKEEKHYLPRSRPKDGLMPILMDNTTISGIIRGGCADCGWEGNFVLAHEQEFYTCDIKKTILTLPEVCAQCPNREYKDGYCSLK